MIVIVTQEDMDNAAPYISSTDCLLATALKRLFPDEEVTVTPFWCCIGETCYSFSEEEEDLIYNAYAKWDDVPETEFPFNVRLVEQPLS